MLTAWRKARARKAALARRAKAHAQDPEAHARLVDHFPDTNWPPLHSVVAGYVAIRDEIDPRSLLETFYCEQVRLALPCVVGPGEPLVFRSWSPGEALEPGAFGIPEPSAEANIIRPDLVLVPVLAFDRRGTRLGYGGGYYDRTLSALGQSGPPVTAIALAHAAQEVRKLPKDKHDVTVNAIVTGHGAVQPNS